MSVARMSPEEVREHYRKIGKPVPDWLDTQPTVEPMKVYGASQPHIGSGKMNKTEALFAELLEAQRLAGNVIEWEFEPGSLLLSPKQGTIPATRYWRDFRAVMKSGIVMAIEVKAGRKSKAGVPHPHFEDGARERLQMAAKKFVEYEWELAWYYLGTWHIERIK